VGGRAGLVISRERSNPVDDNDMAHRVSSASDKTRSTGELEIRPVFI
jgi:hypothetical protein